MSDQQARPAVGVADQSSPDAEPAASEHPLAAVSRPRPGPVNPARLTSGAQEADLGLILTSNPWLLSMRHHRDLAWDAEAEAEARWRLRHPQAVPAAPDPWPALHAAFLGLVAGVAAFFIFVVFPAVPGWAAGGRP